MPIDTGEVRARLAGVKKVIRDFPRVAGNEAVKFFARGFDRGGFTDQGFEPWDPTGKKPRGAGILIESGEGRDSLRVLEVTSRSVRIGSDVAYMAVHNTGGDLFIPAHSRTTENGNTHPVKAHTRHVPQRKFVGNSATLTRHLKLTFIRMVKRA